MHVLILGLLAGFNKWNGLSNETFHLIKNETRCLIEYKSGLPIVAPLPKYIAFHDQYTVHGDLLIVKNHLIAYILLYNGSGGAYAITHLNSRGRIGFFEVFLDLFFVAAVVVGMLVITHPNHLKHEKFALDLADIMKR